MSVPAAQMDRPSVRLYVLDCGKISEITSEEFGFKANELDSQMFTPCYLIVHPDGALLWETGEIPDAEFADLTTPVIKRSFSASRPLLPQLAEVGYSPADITFLAMSHYHNDHVANANLFAGSHWLVQRAEWEAMFAAEVDTAKNGPIAPDRQFFGDLEHSDTTIIENCDHDVFGDGSVVLKYTPGHTAGHQSLFVRLPETGPVLLSGDLYHYTKELHRDAQFVNHASNDQTSISRRAIEAFVDKEDAEIWIQHDMGHAATLKKSPAFYS